MLEIKAVMMARVNFVFLVLKGEEKEREKISRRESVEREEGLRERLCWREMERKEVVVVLQSVVKWE